MFGRPAPREVLYPAAETTNRDYLWKTPVVPITGGDRPAAAGPGGDRGHRADGLARRARDQPLQTGAFVIAEGIEDEETLAFVRSLEEMDVRPGAIIQGGQGYKLGRPVAEMPHPFATVAPAD